MYFMMIATTSTTAVEEDCYIQAILTELGEGFETDTADNLHTLSLEQLKDSASFLKI